MENKRSFFAILPAYVRYDSDLSSTSKLIYAEITALCNDKGYCWATNSYFSSLFNISDRQVRNILKQLSDKYYIKIIIEQKTKRKIFILNTQELNFLRVGKKFPGSPEENFLHNNKNNNINNKNNNNSDELAYLLNYNWFEEN